MFGKCKSRWDGLFGVCRDAKNAQTRKRGDKKRRGRPKPQYKPHVHLLNTSLKWCYGHARYEGVEDFGVNKIRWDGLQPKCRAFYKEVYSVEKDRILRNSRNHYHSNLERSRARKRIVQARNQASKRAGKVRRRASEDRAMPNSISEEENARIREIYKSAQMIGDLHVDHIIPIRGVLPDGKRVLGAHRPSNLQLLEPSDNTSKNNKVTYEDLAKSKLGHDYIFVPDDYFKDVSKYPEIFIP